MVEPGPSAVQGTGPDAIRARRIVVGVDGSECSVRALEWAVDEARRSGAALQLVSAWLFPMALGYAFSRTVSDEQKVAQQVIDLSMASVHALAPEIEVTGETGEQMPAAALVAASVGADLLVVGTRGHGGFEGMLLGSVSQHCARHATCSVVVVR